MWLLLLLYAVARVFQILPGKQQPPAPTTGLRMVDFKKGGLRH
jgi:hypothetical protein